MYVFKNERSLLSPQKFTFKEMPSKIKNKWLVEKKRQRIFEAAAKLFPEKGYHTTSLREISKESGITLGNLYDYITTKEDILYIIQTKTTKSIMGKISRIQKKGFNPVEKLRRLISLELDLVNKYQDLVLIIYQESHVFSKEFEHQSGSRRV
jgi:AcrR family transcriptional regulator